MTLTALFLCLFPLVTVPVLAQDVVYDAIHNVTNIYGTWSSGSQNVVTGYVRLLLVRVLCAPLTSFLQGFAQPANMSFTYPKTTGMSYSLCVILVSFIV